MIGQVKNLLNIAKGLKDDENEPLFNKITARPFRELKKQDYPAIYFYDYGTKPEAQTTDLRYYKGPVTLSLQVYSPMDQKLKDDELQDYEDNEALVNAFMAALPDDMGWELESWTVFSGTIAGTGLVISDVQLKRWEGFGYDHS